MSLIGAAGAVSSRQRWARTPGRVQVNDGVKGAAFDEAAAGAVHVSVQCGERLFRSHSASRGRLARARAWAG